MNILTINLEKSDLGEQLFKSFKETGFAVIENHDIEDELMLSVYREWAEFFKKNEKFEYVNKDSSNSGYIPYKTENAKGYSAKDLKEMYHLFAPYNDLPAGLSGATKELAFKLQLLGYRLLDSLNIIVTRELGKDLDLGSMVEASPKTLFRILHYPPVANEDTEVAVRAAPHTDINLLTILPVATVPGLAVKNTEGKWVLVDNMCKPNSIVFNVGDMLQEATNGLLKSTEHQVLNPTGLLSKSSRYSSPLFMHPRPEVRLSERYTAGEYLEERLREIGLKK